MSITKQDFINLCILINGVLPEPSDYYLDHLGQVYDDFDSVELEAWVDDKMVKLDDRLLRGFTVP